MPNKDNDQSPDHYANLAEDLVAQMSLEEKVALMGGTINPLRMAWEAGILRHYNKTPYPAGGNKRLRIPEVRFCDGPRGLVSNHATCFPVAMQRGASFDIELEERIGEAIGKEIRAVGGNFFGGVCVNLLRHPAGGRAQETYGEDPFHVGQMGSAVTHGVQKQGVMACVKHYALNNQENTRFKIDVSCDERTLREVYLPHFKDCIDAGAASVMGAYNKFRGEYCCQNSYLLNTILKEEWGFAGFTISDFIWGVRDTAAAANAGLDIEMPIPRFYGRKLVKAVQDGRVAETVIDEAARRIVRTVLLFTARQEPSEQYPPALIASQEHVDLAREAAEKSLVLLKNEGPVLPFALEKIRKLAVFGPLAKAPNIGDRGSSKVHPPYVITPLIGLQKYCGPGTEVLYDQGRNLAKAKQLAAQADALVIVAGNSHKDEGEYLSEFMNVGGDRDSLDLHQQDIDLINAVAPLNPNCVVVLIGGSAIMMEAWKAAVPAIIYAFYPGMEGGTAVARALFGAVNPGGKLPFTIPADAAGLPDFDRLAEEVFYDYYHGYTKFEREKLTPAFPFGFGLSYTSFSLANAAFAVEGDQVIASAEVVNTGARAGDQVIQLYVGFENSAVDRPHKLLRGFRRISLAPGESRQVSITCPLEKLRWYNPETSSWELERMTYQAYIGSNSDEEDCLMGTFTL